MGDLIKIVVRKKLVVIVQKRDDKYQKEQRVKDKFWNYVVDISNKVSL